MSTVAPIGSAREYLARREEEPERVIPSEPPSSSEKTPSEIKADVVKQAEKTTLNDFQYTGKGSFIDKVF